MLGDNINACRPQSMIPIKQNRHNVRVEKQNIHPWSGWISEGWLRSVRIMALKASTSEGSLSSDGAKSRTGGLSPGMSTFWSGRFRGSTTFAIAPSLSDLAAALETRLVRQLAVQPRQIAFRAIHACMSNHLRHFGGTLSTTILSLMASFFALALDLFAKEDYKQM
jgi:hypothetical protein